MVVLASVTVRDFILGGSKITADGDCSHEIKRRLFLRRKTLTNLDSILKSGDITLPTKWSRSVMSDSLRPHESQHARPPYPSPTPGVYPNSCPSSQWWHPTISSSVVPFSSCPQSFSESVFSNESALHIRWPKYWSFSFSISPSSEYSGLIFFRIDWLDLLAVQGTLKSLLQHHSLKVSIFHHSTSFMVQLSHLHMTTDLLALICFLLHT